MKCSATEELSIKCRLRNGTPRYICKSCRRMEYHRKKGVWRTQANDADLREEHRRIERMIIWDMLAQEINSRIINKYSRV